ncbi:hypothetical protein [Bacillus sp. FSL K6-2971]|uniref:hypothetical protein n=1 Tax=Bacillus sp. FSL K6-2971 TaxID=2921487 RepID=UPI0030F6D163
MKPEITKEQSEAIEFLREIYSDEWIIRFYIEDTLSSKGERELAGYGYEVIYEIGLLTLAAALINGYKVAGSPEETLQEYYVEALHTARDEATGHDIQDAIRYTLETLGIKIEGVNA